MIGPIKLVSVVKNVISVYNAKISNGWIKPAVAAIVNLTLDVAQNTRVLNPYIITQPNSNEFKNKSKLNSLEIMDPATSINPKKVIERPHKNIECLIFRFIP